MWKKKEILSLDVEANEFGSFSGEFKIPEDCLKCQYELRTDLSKTSIKVEDYKIPKFEVKFLPSDQKYQCNDTLQIKGQAISFSNYPIDGAKVSYKVKTDNLILQSNEIITDKNGIFSFLILISDQHRYDINCTITDKNGESHKLNKVIYNKKKKMVITSNIEDFISKDDNAYEFNINIKNYSKININKKATIEVVKLKQKNKANLENISGYQSSSFVELNYCNINENIKEIKGNFIDGNIILHDSLNLKKDQLYIFRNVNNWKSGLYKININSANDDTTNTIFSQYFIVFSPRSKEMPIKSDFIAKLLKKEKNGKNIQVNTDDYIKETSDNGYFPGDSIKFILGSSNKPGYFYYEVVNREKAIKGEWVELNNETKQISIPVKENYRGNFQINIISIYDNQPYEKMIKIKVPWDNKKVQISKEVFRSKLYPGTDEKWKVKIKGYNNNLIAGEMVAVLYDATMDKLSKKYSQNSYFYNTLYNDEWFRNFHPNSFINSWGYNYRFHNNKYYRFANEYMDENNRLWKFEMDEDLIEMCYLIAEDDGSSKNEVILTEDNKFVKHKNTKNSNLSLKLQKGSIPIRKDFRETAFFYPHLYSNDSGEVEIEFTVPDALTRWKFKAFAHTKDLKYGTLVDEVITQKELMVVPNPPRFLREDDSITFTSKIINLSGNNSKGKVTLELIDPITDEIINKKFNLINNERDFKIIDSKSALISWNLSIPKNITGVIYRIKAVTENYSDGEEKFIPILPNRTLITETLPMFLNKNEEKSFSFEKLKNSVESNTLKHHKLTFEFNTNPLWLVLQSLPYLIEYPYECNEQLFSRYYANSIVLNILNSNQKIKKIFNEWVKIQT